MTSPPPNFVHPPFLDDDVYALVEKQWVTPEQPATQAAMQAVRAGWPDDVPTGLDAERSEFLKLIFSEDTRRRLEPFVSANRG